VEMARRSVDVAPVGSEGWEPGLKRQAEFGGRLVQEKRKAAEGAPIAVMEKV